MWWFAVAMAAPAWRPQHPMVSSSLAGVMVPQRGDSTQVTGFGGRLEEAVLLPFFVQARGDLAVFRNAAGPALSEWGYDGQVSGGLHFPFLTRDRHIVITARRGRTEYGRFAGYRWSLHSFGVLGGVGFVRGVEPEPEPVRHPRFAVTGTHVFAPMWANAGYAEEGPARGTASLHWQLGVQGPERFAAASVTLGWFRVGLSHRFGEAGWVTGMEVGAQLQVARDVAFEM